MERSSNRNAPDLETLGIVTSPWGGAGKKWILPHRDLGRWRHLGWLAFVPGLILLPFVYNIFRFFQGFGLQIFGNPKGNGPAGLVDWIPLLIVIPIGLVFLGILWQVLKVVSIGVGVLSQSTRTEIELDEKGLVSREVVGWKKFRRQVKDRESLLSLAVVTGEEWAKLRRRIKSEGGATVVPLPEHLRYMLIAKRSDADMFVVSFGYSADILGALARDMGQVLRLAPATILEKGLASVVLSSAGGEDDDDEVWTSLEAGALPTKPEDSKVSLEKREDGLTIQIPSQGLLKGSKGLFFFAILWTAFSTFMTVIFALAMTGAIPGKVDGSPFIAVLVMSFFELIGIVMLVASIHMGTRTSTIATSYGMLFISTTSIFGKKTRQWEREGISRIEIAPSGMSVNDRAVMQLAVVEKGEKTFGCLTQLNDAEIEWIAYELNQSLELLPPPIATPPVL